MVGAHRGGNRIADIARRGGVWTPMWRKQPRRIHRLATEGEGGDMMRRIRYAQQEGEGREGERDGQKSPSAPFEDDQLHGYNIRLVAVSPEKPKFWATRDGKGREIQGNSLPQQ